VGRYFARTILATASIASSLVAASPADAYQVKRTPSGNSVRWDGKGVDVHLSPSLADLDGGNDVIVKTFESWSGLEGAPHVSARYEGAAADPAYDRNNSVFFMPKAYEPAGRALAITILTYDNKTGLILDSDIVVNGKYHFAWLPEDGTHPEMHDKDIYDIEHVLAHESGHVLGLSDELSRNDVLMYRYSSPNDASLRTPTEDDKDGLAEIYSRAVVPQEESGGCGDSTVSPSRPGRKTGQLGFAFGVGFVTFLAARRRKNAARMSVAGAASFATFALTMLPSLERTSHARSAEMFDQDTGEGHATASIVRAASRFDRGLIRTQATLRIDSCRVAACPKVIDHNAWGGTVGNVTQVFGHDGAPEAETKVHLTFDHPVNVWERMKPGFVAESADPGRVTTMRRTRATHE